MSSSFRQRAELNRAFDRHTKSKTLRALEIAPGCFTVKGYPGQRFSQQELDTLAERRSMKLVIRRIPRP